MNNFSCLSERARKLWAKSSDDGGHGLLAHLLDVAAAAEVILEREPDSTIDWAAQAFGLERDQASRWVACLVGLHDFGKAIPGFQTKWLAGRMATEALGLDFPTRSLSVTDHACASAALLGECLAQREIAPPQWIRHALQSISAHHGYNFSQTEINRGKPAREPSAWSDARREILEAYWRTLAPQGRSHVDALSMPAVQWLAGLTSVADWIGSNTAWFPMGERHEVLAEHHADAMRLARKALDAVGWPRYTALHGDTSGTDELIARIVQRPGLRARPLQREADRLLVDIQGPALLLVEAPMGEGKTELAFLAHLRLQAANRHRGLYVALPTQATGNALFQRALTFLRSFAGDDRIDMQLVHGGAMLNEQVIRLRGIHGAQGQRGLVRLVFAATPPAAFALRRWDRRSGVVLRAQRQAPLRPPLGVDQSCRGPRRGPCLRHLYLGLDRSPAALAESHGKLRSADECNPAAAPA